MSFPRASRKRKGIELTLSDEARSELEKLAEDEGTSQSRVVEAWLMTQYEYREHFKKLGPKKKVRSQTQESRQRANEK